MLKKHKIKKFNLKIPIFQNNSKFLKTQNFQKTQIFKKLKLKKTSFSKTLKLLKPGIVVFRVLQSDAFISKCNSKYSA